MNPEYKIVNIRVFRGLNLLEDARITDPGSFTRLQNIYRKAPGVLASRPGSIVFARGDAFQIGAPVDTPLADSDLLNDSYQLLTDIVLTDSSAELINEATGTLRRGLRTRVPRILPKPIRSGTVSASAPGAAQLPADITIPSAPTVSTKVAYVEAIHRLYTDFGTRRFLIGAYAMEGEGDRLFYVDDEDGTPTCRLMAYPQQLVGSGATWQFVNFFVEDPSFTGQEIHAIGTNGAGMPFFVSILNGKPVPGQLAVVKSSDFPSSGAVPATTLRLAGVRSMCVYNGSVVYGGYRYETATGGSREDKLNYICFSEPGEPWRIATTDGEISDIRIGDTKYEPVTFVTTNSVANDSQGIKGQLVVFTTKRVVTYDGLPPVSGNPTGVAFHSVVLADVGCNAPKTVCQTPAGILFLGTDGLVYIIPRFSNGGPIPVSRTVESVFRHLSLRQQSQCAAVYDDGQYKISIPEVNYSERGFTTLSASLGNKISPYGNQGAVIPDAQYWLDIREPMDPSRIDFGYVWTGPHTGMKHSCFAKGTQHEDSNILWAGSAIDGTIYQTSIEGLASDPSPETPTTTVPLKYNIQTGQFDAGDIHVDKSVKSVQYGMFVSAALDITSSIFTSGEVAGSTAGESFTDSFVPVGTLLDGNTTMGDLILAPPNSFRFESNHPSSPKRGRTFSFAWTASPASAAIIKFSDLAFIFEVHKRRE